MLQYSCLENPVSDREAWQATVYRVGKSWTPPKQPYMPRCKTFFCPWQLCLSESWAWRWHSCLACRDPGGAKCGGTGTASAAGVMVLSESFFWPLVAGNQKASGQSFSIAPPVQSIRGLPCLGSFSVAPCIRPIKGPRWLGSYSVDRRSGT